MGKMFRGKVSPDVAMRLRQQTKRTRKAAQLAKAAKLKAPLDQVSGAASRQGMAKELDGNS